MSALLAPGAALAQEPGIWGEERESQQGEGFGLVRYADDEHLVTDMGVALMLGGGPMVRLGDRETDATGAGGAWHARGVLGTRSFIAGELGYFGAANPVAEGLPVAEGAVLLSNGAEVNVRPQLPIPVGVREDVILAPFVTAGVGAQAYDLVNADTEITNDGQIGDDIAIHLPVGGGLAVMTSGFIADARVSYRPSIANDRDLFGQPTAFDNALDELAVTGSVGVEF